MHETCTARSWLVRMGSLVVRSFSSVKTNAYNNSVYHASCEVIFMESSLVILGSFEDGDAH